jgi:thiol-disulfide isomerase/thioredoxin
MRKFLVLTCACLISLITFSQTVIENPLFSATTASYVKIKKIELHDTVTAIDFEVEYTPDMWIRVMENDTYIQDSKGGEKLFVKRADGIILNQTHKTPASGKNIYTLFFPPVDKSVETIDYLEEQWKIFDIELKPQEHFSVIPKAIQGSWFRTDGSNEWVYGFYDNLVIHKEDFWNQVLINNKGKTYQVSLQKDGKQEIIHIKLSKNNKLLIGTDPDKLELFSRDKTTNPDYVIPNDTEFQLPVFKKDTAIYKGYINGYHLKMGSTGMAYVNDIIAHEQYPELITIHPDGTFYAEIPMIHFQDVFIRIPGFSESLFFEPGTTTLHCIDLTEYNNPFKNNQQDNKREKKSLFMGETARINSDMQAMDSINYLNFNAVQKVILSMSADEYKNYHLEILNREQAALANYSKNNLISKKALQIKQFQIPYRIYENILSYRMEKVSAYRTINNIPREQREIPLEFEELSPDYYDFIYADDLNNPLSLVSGSAYNILINRIRFADCVLPKSNFVYVALMDTIEQNGIEITAEEKMILEKLIACKTNDCLREVKREDTTVWNRFTKKHSELLSSIGMSAFEKMQYKNLQEYFGLNDGLAKEIILAQSRCESMSGLHKPFSDADKDEISREITNEFIVEYLMTQSKILEDEITRKLEENKEKTGYIINETPDTKADKVFDAIIQKYKGKVIFVDFWATWCGPCLSGIERIKPLKEEIKDRDIVFVYITNQTSPVDTWNMMIPDIKGEHYRLETDEWNFLSSKFNISGIPHYVLVDKDGTVVKDKLYFASTNQELSKIFEEYLGKF